MGKVVCPWDTLINFVTDAFVGYGIPREDAEICTDILLESDRRGIESHGCNRFKPIYLDRIKAGIQNPITDFEVVKETPCTAVVDGHDGMGQVIGYKSMQMAIDKAKKYGMGMVAVRNSTMVLPAIMQLWQQSRAVSVLRVQMHVRLLRLPLVLTVCSVPTRLLSVFQPMKNLILLSIAQLLLLKTVKLSIMKE